MSRAFVVGKRVVRVYPSQEVVDAARKRATDAGDFTASLKGKGGRLVGFLGEEVVFDISRHVTRSECYDYDALAGDYSVDIKTKLRTVECRQDFEASVWCPQKERQQNDLYIFCSIKADSGKLEYVDIMGCISKRRYFERASYRPAGKIDRSNGFNTPIACYNLEYSALSPAMDLLKGSYKTMPDATLFLRNKEARQTAMLWIGELPDFTKVEFSKPKRTVSQSDRMWAHVTDVSKSGHEHFGRKHTPTEWKLIFMGHLGVTMDVVPGLYGQGVVDLGQSSSKLNKEQMTDLITLIEAYCAENGIVLGDSVTTP